MNQDEVEVGRKIRTDYEKLYGDYPELNENELAYLTVITDPNVRLQKLRDEDIAQLLCLNKKSIYNYRHNPKVREAVSNEIMLKSSDQLGNMLHELEDMCKKQGNHTKIPANTQFQAIKLWMEVNQIVRASKEDAIEGKQDKKLTFEERLKKGDADYNRRNILETEE